MKTARLIPKELIEAQWRRTHEGRMPVARLEALAAPDRTVDPGIDIYPLFVAAFEAEGGAAAGQVIRFAVREDDPANPTGTAFLADGVSAAAGYGMTDSAGVVMPTESLRAGMSPGVVFVRATAPLSGGEGIHADYTIRVSDATPAQFKILSGGDESFQVGTEVLVEAIVQLLDAAGKPIPYGTVRFHIEDPNGTQSQLESPENPIAWMAVPVDSEGKVGFYSIVSVGDGAPGKSFAIRMSRDGRAPYHDLTYRTLAIPAT